MTLLGVIAHHTPLAASDIAQLAAAMCSFTEAVFILEQRGCVIDIKTLRSITYHVADKSRIVQQANMALKSHTVEGKRCAVSVDDGRIRTRVPKRGKKTV